MCSTVQWNKNTNLLKSLFGIIEWTKITSFQGSRESKENGFWLSTKARRAQTRKRNKRNNNKLLFACQWSMYSNEKLQNEAFVIQFLSKDFEF